MFQARKPALGQQGELGTRYNFNSVESDSLIVSLVSRKMSSNMEQIEVWKKHSKQKLDCAKKFGWMRSRQERERGGCQTIKNYRRRKKLPPSLKLQYPPKSCFPILCK